MDATLEPQLLLRSRRQQPRIGPLGGSMPQTGTTAHHTLTIGELSQRSGVAPSALHFYERSGLISSERSPGNQRRYRRDALRRVAFIRVSQRVGIPLKDIRTALESLPDGRTPTKRDWTRLSRLWRTELDQRIAALEHLRRDLDGCIGCGCLSLKACRLQNPEDVLGDGGSGALRWEPTNGDS
ncbi:redox-sensitive transcriptional activator SoxR [Pseudarthrobacter sp. J64]|uniref:redox-sensitive transcriptional activator SoxR n=1 Tax=Pseudarthrobacter sp. J64 TaxID=3116485 RepID=UPI002E7FD2D7|nr:redox-sensitive transcriptional activator SoxR [Pseudarthrobacter sp. J64]MEE2568793.1 redox-sensitive transcriptional activator SoxR [Pseudarthrobacter sp. J64]